MRSSAASDVYKRQIRIESSPEIEVELDGELLGHTPLEFTMLRRAIRVVVSREFLESME